MPETLAKRRLFWFSCCVFFTFFSILFAAHGTSMLVDTDPFWHIASGDLIRANHTIPEHDPWSFTAGDYRWLNISWLWDAIFSIIHEHLGWHGAMAINAMTMALTITLIYANCMARSKNFLAAFLATLGALSILSFHLRPLQFSGVMVGLWLLLLGLIARGNIKSLWLAVLPPLMVIWVNIHGGFIIAPVLLGAFFLQSIYDRNIALARNIFVTGIAVLATTLCNPYGIDIYTGVWRSINSVAAQFISEWKPFTTSAGDLFIYLYLVVFCALVPRQKLPLLAAERWLAYGWLFLGLISVRNMSMFAIVSAPIFACALTPYLKSGKPTPWAVRATGKALAFCSRKSSLLAMFLLSAGMIIWLPTPMAAHMFGQETIAVASLDPEIAFIKTHYPKARLLNYYNFGGLLIYETRGAIPVFVDQRAETAIPPQIFTDYACFQTACDGWESMMDRYKLDGILIPSEKALALQDRFQHRKGWKMVFKGPLATIYMRTPTKP